MKSITIFALACILAAGCENKGGDGAAGGTLAGTRWRLAAWTAGSSDPARFTITAEFSESQISGTSAVNSYGGTYTATAAGAFSVGELQSTLMAGDADAMQAESTYLALLQQARKYAVDDASLFLRDANGQNLLIFHPR